MDASWFEPVRAYCERTDAGFWAEPVNALTNAAFLLAAGLAVRRARGDGPVLALAAVVFVVGLGSFLFHTLANRWSMLADVIPIAVFIYGYFALTMIRFFGLGPLVATAVTLAFAAFNLGLTPALDALSGRSVAGLTNGSIDYVPAILALLGVGLALLPRAPGPARSCGGGGEPRGGSGPLRTDGGGGERRARGSKAPSGRAAIGRSALSRPSRCLRRGVEGAARRAAALCEPGRRRGRAGAAVEARGGAGGTEGGGRRRGAARGLRGADAGLRSGEPRGMGA